jgi:hypothetical protein
MIDWFTPVIGLSGVVLGVGITEVRRWLESKNIYRKVTFEKRLAVHQEALGQSYLLGRIISSQIDDEEKITKVREIEKWWNNNCLYLDEKSCRKMFNLVFDSFEHINGLSESQNAIYRKLRETRIVIARGIGVKHLPEVRNLTEDEKMWQNS